MVLTALYSIDRNPSLILSNKKPYEMLWRKPSSFTHLKVFDSLCYTSTLAHTTSEFDPRAPRYIFLGYPLAIKSYRLYELDNLSTFFFVMLSSMKPLFPLKSISHNLDQFHTLSSVVLPQPFPTIQITFSIVIHLLPLPIMILFKLLHLEDHLEYKSYL